MTHASDLTEQHLRVVVPFLQRQRARKIAFYFVSILVLGSLLFEELARIIYSAMTLWFGHRPLSFPQFTFSGGGFPSPIFLLQNLSEIVWT